MSGRDTKSYIAYLGGPLKSENEPEEGEIVDDYDLIVSSDEELCMRERIRELEAENEEIEQIAVISRSYVDKINHPRNHLESSRAAQVPTDVSSISSTEFVTPRKRKRRRSREHKRKHCHRQHPHEHNNQYEQILRYDIQLPQKIRSKKTHCKRRQKLFAKKQKKIHSDRLIHKKLNAESLSLESLESSGSSSLTDTDNYGCSWLATKRKEEQYNKEKHIARDTLRLAVARNTNESRLTSKKYCLKDKLLKQELVRYPSNIALNDRYTFVESRDTGYGNNDEDDDVQVIENEPDVQTVDEDSTDSMEEKELRLIALKSAVLKKHMARKMRNAEAAYSPTDFDEMLSSGILREDKLDDIDVVDLEAEDSQTAYATVSPEASPQLILLEDQEECQQMVDCKPVDMDIANSDSEDVTIDSWPKDVEPSVPKYSLDPYDFTNNVQYDFHMQDLNELPPPPPGVDDYMDVPPPPPYHTLYIKNSHDMHVDSAEPSQDHRMEEEIYIPEGKGTDSDKVSVLPRKEFSKNEEFDDDEEEEALRALLLSKFQSPKNQKKMTKSPKEEQDTPNGNKALERNHTETKPTETILKEAVKRLQVYSQSELSKEETRIDKVQEYSQKNCDSSNLWEKLRNRLNLHKNQSQKINTELIKDDTTECLFEQQQSGAKCFTGTTSEQLQLPNYSEVTNSIDISDITRRLQKIKENVLNSNFYNSVQNQLTCSKSMPQDDTVQSEIDYIEDAENVKEYIQPSLGNICKLKKKHSNNISNIDLINKESNDALAKNKANFDLTTNQPTFKVAITSNAALKSDSKDNSNTLGDVTYKTNNANNVPKNLILKFDENTKSNVDLNNDRLEKMNNRATDSNVGNNDQVNESIPVVKSIMNDIKIIPKPSYSLTRNTKIIKPNKVVNANFDFQSKQTFQAADSTLVLNKSKSEVNNQLSNMSDNSRLITSVDQVKHMCKVNSFVISLQNSSNESSDGEWGGDYDSLYKPLYDYNDNCSPLSLNMESPSRTPLRSNSPIERSAEGDVEQKDFEACRLKTKVTSIQKENIADTTPSSNLAGQHEKSNKTPLAVRHLPPAAQNEYRRLVHRMKLLESKRKCVHFEEKKSDRTLNKQIRKILPIAEDSGKEMDKTDSTNSVPKTSLVKKVLLRNVSNNKSTPVTANDPQIANGSSGSTKLHKGNILKSYENLYIKFGTGIVNNLDKSLKLVEEAKEAKIAKLKLENRLKELKAEMDSLQSKHKEEQQKISLIYPNICTTNEVITSLKQKRSKVFKAALNLGKTLKGDCYRLNNDLKEIITTKSSKLAAEIKIVNSLKAQDIKSSEVEIKPNTIEEQQTDQGEKIETRRTKSKENKVEMKSNPDFTTDSTKICSKICKEDEEKNNPKPHIKIKVCGNTEFQNLETNDTKPYEYSANTCRGDMDLKSNNVYSEKDSEQTLPLPSYISPLEHLRNIDRNVDPNGVVCPFDLMGNCEDVTCKYVHITPKAKT